MPTAGPTAPTAREEWRSYGLVAAAALAGISVGTIPTATLGLFMEPLHREFGWSRTEISLGLTIFALVGLPLGPLGGILVDRFGARRMVIPGLAFSGAAIAAFSLLSGAYWQWVLIWILYTLASIGTRTLVWNSAISSFFITSRGLAIAVLLCGTALATSLAPSVTHWLIVQWGWRAAYVGLGLGWAGAALLLVLAFFRDGRTAKRSAAAAEPLTRPQLGGLSVRQALRTPRLYRIAAAMFVQAVLGAAILVHFVPLLTAEGLSRGEAAGMAAIIGTGSIIGKLATGWLIDRFSGSLIPVACYSGPAVGYLLIMESGGSAWALAVAVFVLGYCSGASLQLATYLTTRYGGMRNFGTIFGFISAFMGLAAGVGPPLAGAIFDTTGGYDLLLMLAVPLALLAGALVFGLGPYPDFRPEEDTVSAPSPDGTPAPR